MNRFSVEGLVSPSADSQAAGDLLAGTFRFLGREVQAGWPPDWGLSNENLLWRFNLHYLNWCWDFSHDEAGYGHACEAFRSWMASNPPGRRSAGWHPYVVSLRLQNLVTLFAGRWHHLVQQDAAMQQDLWTSCFMQAEWLLQRLEYRLGANHLFENGVALYLAGRCFRGRDASRWEAKGRALLEKELSLQQLGDGLHCERSPMYHLRFHYTLELLVRAADEEWSALLRDRLQRSRDALGLLTHPDGNLALFQDTAFGIYAPAQTWLEDWPAWEGAWSLPASGYYGWRSSEGHYIAVDVGGMGPSYNPGHGHSGLFSYELSVGGRRVIVDSGVSGYEPGPMRDYARSTPAHNTVTVNGVNQSETWASFRVGRSAASHLVAWEPADNGFLLNAWHDGYAWMKGSPLHRRVLAVAGGRLRVVDEILSRRSCTSTGRIHLHPDCRVMHAGSAAEVQYPGGKVMLEADGSAVWRVEESWYCPEFGRQQKNLCLCLDVEGEEAVMAYTLVFEA